MNYIIVLVWCFAVGAMMYIASYTTVLVWYIAVVAMMYGCSLKKYLHLYLGKCKGKGKAHVMDLLNGMQSRY